LASAVPAAWIGLKLMRQGRWEGPSRISLVWSHLRLASVRGRRKRFGSALGAQVWLEWRTKGWRLPAISGGMAFLVVGVGAIPLLMFRHGAGEAGSDGYPEMMGLLSMFILPLLILPLVLSVLLAPALA